MIAAVTGHRPDKLTGWDPLHPVIECVRKALRHAFASDWPQHVITGMALGVDTWAAEVCIELGIPFVAALPCTDWGVQWPPFAQTRQEKLLTHAKEVHIVSPGPYKPWKLQRRNEWMVDNCDVLLSIWDGSDGGTRNCLMYATEVGRTVKPLTWRQTL
jgi:uncharacterized phage-like protein YoqJ